MTQYKTITLEKHQEELLKEFAPTILNGTVEQARRAFEIIFEETPETEQDLQIFKKLCEIAEGDNKGIIGVIKGGQKTH